MPKREFERRSTYVKKNSKEVCAIVLRVDIVIGYQVNGGFVLIEIQKPMQIKR